MLASVPVNLVVGRPVSQDVVRILLSVTVPPYVCPKENGFPFSFSLDPNLYPVFLINQATSLFCLVAEALLFPFRSGPILHSPQLQVVPFVSLGCVVLVCVSLLLLLLAGNILLHPRQVVINRIRWRRRRRRAVHALAQLVLDGGASGGVVSCRGPACCALYVSISFLFSFFCSSSSLLIPLPVLDWGGWERRGASYRERWT